MKRSSWLGVGLLVLVALAPAISFQSAMAMAPEHHQTHGLSATFIAPDSPLACCAVAHLHCLAGGCCGWDVVGQSLFLGSRAVQIFPSRLVTYQPPTSVPEPPPKI